MAEWWNSRHKWLRTIREKSHAGATPVSATYVRMGELADPKDLKSFAVRRESASLSSDTNEKNEKI